MVDDTGRKTLTLKKVVKRRSPRKVNVVWVNRSGLRRTESFDVIKSPSKKPAKKVKAPPPKKKLVIVKKPKGPAFTPPKERIPLQEAIDDLSKYWPGLFPEGRLVVMEAGIKKKLKIDRKARDLDISWRRVKECLGSIGYSLAYQELVVLGAERYNKDGTVVGTVDAGSVEFSQKKIERIKKIQRSKNLLIKKIF